MEYNSNNILKIEHIFSHTYKQRAKKDKNVTFVFKNLHLCYILFFLHLIANTVRDLVALIKSCV